MKKLLVILLLFPMFIFAEKPFFLQQDKQLHILAGAVISQTVYNYTINKTNNKTEAIAAALFSTILIGTLKETYDSRKGGSGFNLKDLGATVIGCSIIIPISITQAHRKKNK